VQFFWVKENDSGNSVATRLTNITNQEAGELLAAGRLSLAYFTGNALDNNTDVLLVGRNNDSGTRLDAEAEGVSSAGAFGFGQSTEQQWQPIITSSLVTGVTSVGDAGYASGGSVATALLTAQHSGATDTHSKSFILVGYLGLSDKATAVAGGATVLTFDGVDGTVTSNIQNGPYSFWSYEHTYELNSDSGAQQTLVTSITTDLANNEVAQSGVSTISGFPASRSVEGGTITP
jgi:hypothetical protein